MYRQKKFRLVDWLAGWMIDCLSQSVIDQLDVIKFVWQWNC